LNERVTPFQAGSSFTELVDMLRAYIKQETVGELRGTWRWLGWGAVGGISILLGCLFVLVGALRLLQSTVFENSTSLSWLPYFIVLATTIALVLFSQSRIRKPFLYRKEI